MNCSVKKIISAIIVVSMLFYLAGCFSKAGDEGVIYITRHGMGLDKWASTWLIKRHIDTNASVQYLQITDSDKAVNQGILFDTEHALYKRSAQRSTFSAMATAFNVRHSSIKPLQQLVHDIEINYWGSPKLPYANMVEKQYRQLQFEFGFSDTPLPCYLAFFDNVAANIEVLATSPARAKSVKLVPDKSCAKGPLSAAVSREKLVQEWPVVAVLSALRQGKKVLFVDVREPEEFKESHIPGAINLQIRDIRQYNMEKILAADLVIPYCVKDFRGFEMARLLKQHGVKDVALMKPYGLTGWLKLGLPAVDKKSNEQQAVQALQQCVERSSQCVLDLESA